MTLDQIPLFAMLKSQMGYLSQRATVISENVANSDTPGYTPRDLEPFKINMPTAGSSGGGGLSMAPVQGSGASMSGIPIQAGSTSSSASITQAWKAQDAPDSEARLDGNKVVLEEQMIKLNEARSSYDTAVSIYQKSMGLIELALRAPGKGA